MLEKDFGVLRLGSVAGIRIHHELGIWQVLRQQEGIDREDDNVFAPMHNQGSLGGSELTLRSGPSKESHPICGSPPTERLPPSRILARRDPRREASVVRYRLAPRLCWPHSE